MTGKERVLNVLAGKPVDRLPYTDFWWAETKERYIAEGHVDKDADFCEVFGADIRGSAWLNMTADLDFKDEVVAETEDTVTIKNGNGAYLKRHKKHTTTPEHVDFEVKDRECWERLIKPHLLEIDERRIPFEGYRHGRQRAAERGEFFVWGGVGPFELMHPISGHEYMLMGMALDPDWVKDMVHTLVDASLRHLDALFEREGLPDGAWIYEDMGFKERPFMSPDMYMDIVQPGHVKMFDYFHDRGLKVILHSCGFVEPLVPGLVEAGIDCLQAMEVKAGMHMPRIAEKFKDRIAFMGNIDVRLLAANDLEGLKKEMDAKIIPLLESGGRYIVHSDHSIPPEVDFETLKYFFEYGASLAKHYRPKG